MSRRTTFLITATFLVLLAIPGIYLTFTWSTHNPLRFEVTRLKVEDQSSSYIFGTMDITMRNASNLPLYLNLSQIAFERKTKPGLGFAGVITLKLEDGSKKPFAGELHLPPGGSVSFEFIFMGEGDGSDARKYLEAVEARYRWRSGTVEKIDKLYERYIHRRPEDLGRFIPRPKESHDRARLEFPATLSP